MTKEEKLGLLKEAESSLRRVLLRWANKINLHAAVTLRSALEVVERMREQEEQR